MIRKVQKMGMSHNFTARHPIPFLQTFFSLGLVLMRGATAGDEMIQTKR